MAYILAHSVWLYYECNWIKTTWTRESIQFMEELEDRDNSQGGGIFVWKPYISVGESDTDVVLTDVDDLDGVIHPYNKIRALGIMLAEIGKGSPVRSRPNNNDAQVLAAEINENYLLALDYAKNDRLWGEQLEYPKYWQAVVCCLEPKNFDASDSRGDAGLQERRNSLWENVVHPLEVLVHAVGWWDNLTNISPLRSQRRLHTPGPAGEKDHQSGTPAARYSEQRKPSASQKGSARWLSRMRQLNKELETVVASDGSIPAKPIRIAVLDTGFDDEALFFDLPENSRSLNRVKGWRDFVDSADHWQDTNGHGTHLVSLVLTVAPKAEVYVARIARDTDDLGDASENVAQVRNLRLRALILPMSHFMSTSTTCRIENCWWYSSLIRRQAIYWATEECKADIISMSFGYTDKQPCIQEAIRKSIDVRKESIIFLGAASNSGSNDGEAFPARLSSVISIRATNSAGQFQDFNPPLKRRHETAIGTLGCDVPGAWKRDFDGTAKYCSGTSVATAVGAGLAAVLLSYVQTQSARDGFKKVNRVLRTGEGMQEVFFELAQESLNERFLYLHPWRMMGISDGERWSIFQGTFSHFC